MNEPIKYFSLFKNDKKKETQPDYKISVKVGDVYMDAGAGWVKDGKKGKYLSCKLNDEFHLTVHTKPMTPEQEVEEHEKEVPPAEYEVDGKVVSSADIPF